MPSSEARQALDLLVALLETLDLRAQAAVALPERGVFLLLFGQFLARAEQAQQAVVGEPQRILQAGQRQAGQHDSRSLRFHCCSGLRPHGAARTEAGKALRPA